MSLLSQDSPNPHYSQGYNVELKDGMNQDLKPEKEMFNANSGQESQGYSEAPPYYTEKTDQPQYYGERTARYPMNPPAESPHNPMDSAGAGDDVQIYQADAPHSYKTTQDETAGLGNDLEGSSRPLGSSSHPLEPSPHPFESPSRPFEPSPRPSEPTGQPQFYQNLNTAPSPWMNRPQQMPQHSNFPQPPLPPPPPPPASYMGYDRQNEEGMNV